MDIITQICGLLEKQTEHFLHYETATLCMLECPPEDVENYITERARLATEIDDCTEKIKRLCADHPDGETLWKAARNSIEFTRLPSEYHCIFYTGQNMRSVMSRIAESEKQVDVRLEKLRDEAMAGIRQNQNVPKIKQYLTNLVDKPMDASLTNGKA